MSRFRIALAAAIGLAAAALMGVALAGCGESSPDPASTNPAQMVAVAKHVTERAKSFLASGLVPDTARRVRVDLHIVPGVGAVGEFLNSPFIWRVVRIGQKIYFKGEARDYQPIVGARIAERLQGRWLQASIDNPRLKTLKDVTELKYLLGSNFDQGNSFSMGGATAVVGTKVVEVTDHTTGETLDVASSGKPYLTQILPTGVQSNEGIVFNHWNRHVLISAPANAVDIEKLPIPSRLRNAPLMSVWTTGGH
jgi:hypothetical protein